MFFPQYDWPTPKPSQNCSQIIVMITHYVEFKKKGVLFLQIPQHCKYMPSPPTSVLTDTTALQLHAIPTNFCSYRYHSIATACRPHQLLFLQIPQHCNCMPSPPTSVLTDTTPLQLHAVPTNFCSYRYHIIATACHRHRLLTPYNTSQFSTHNAMASVGNF